MKCPYCNIEHPEGYKFCPETGKEMVSLKACTLNPNCPDIGKHILPLDSTYCPTCGSQLEEISENSRVSRESLKFPIIDNFFPLKTVFIGKTRTVDINQSKYEVSKTYGEAQFCTTIDGVFFLTENCEDTRFIHAYISNADLVSFSEWDKINFNKGWSFLKLKTFFENMGFSVRVSRKPQLRRYKCNTYFDAAFKAVASDESVTFVFDFSGDGNDTPSTLNTLKIVQISTHTNIDVEGIPLGQIIKQWD